MNGSAAAGTLRPPGLSAAQAERRLAAEGPNDLPQLRRPSLLRQFVGQLTHLLAVLLWVASGLAVLAGQPMLAVAIVIVIVLNAIFAFAQEVRADRSAERLQTLLPLTARVRRGGRAQQIPADQIVRGDLVLLTAGDRVPADLDLLEAHSLALDESMLTGESTAVRHGDGDRVLAGTFVIQGQGEAEVCTTGAGTQIAAIAQMTRAARRPPSPLTRQLARVVRIVAVIAVVAGTLLGASGLALGLRPTQAFLFAVGVSVALVPEGLLPTVTLSLARGAALMAERQALVRRLDAVETLGATTFICTDKTGTLTQNRMSVVEVWTRAGQARISGLGYEPDGRIQASPGVIDEMRRAAVSALACTSGRAIEKDDGTWVADGDPMDAALHAWSLRLRAAAGPGAPIRLRLPYTADRMLTSAASGVDVHVLGAPEAVMARCVDLPLDARTTLATMAERGRRVLAIGYGRCTPETKSEDLEQDLVLGALVGIEDPPRPDVGEALEACRRAGIRVAMVTGDHPGTAAAIAREVGLLREGGVVLDGQQLPPDDELVAALEHPGGAVVARISPAGKVRIAETLRRKGHVVAMTGDGVNDAPALRAADVGVAMGVIGSDVAKEAADLVLLDDNFATIVAAVELGRATFVNVRRFLTYHLTDNVAELAPFAAWALSGGSVPLAIGVLQVLALDIGTDLLPALALGSEPPSSRTMRRPPQKQRLVDSGLLVRALLVLGGTEALVSMSTFLVVLRGGGWQWGQDPPPTLLAVASGSAFACIVLAQLANAYACRSETLSAWKLAPLTNRLLLLALPIELILLVVFVGVPWLARLLGGSWPSGRGWLMGLAAVGAVIIVDASHKYLRSRARP